MSYAPSDTVDARRLTYRRLQRRNRFVGVLRFLVPGAGLAVFGVLAGQVIVANLAENFSIGKISIVSDKMVVETPSFGGVTGDGTSYEVTAASAEAPLGDPNTVTLIDALLVINSPSGVQTTAEAGRAELKTAEQTVSVTGTTEISTSAGMVGTIDDMFIDMSAQTMRAAGKVDLQFPGGQTIAASAVTYDAGATTWQFERVTLFLPSTPGEEE